MMIKIFIYVFLPGKFSCDSPTGVWCLSLSVIHILLTDLAPNTDYSTQIKTLCHDPNNISVLPAGGCCLQFCT